VTLYGDEFSVYKRRRGRFEGYDGANKSLALADSSFSVRFLFYLPPGACLEPLIARIVDDIIKRSKDGFVVYDGCKKEEVAVRGYLSLAAFDSPMAARFSNSIGPSGTEHFTSCDAVHPKTISRRSVSAVSSTESFDIQDTKYFRVQERTHAIMSAVKGSVDQSADSLRDALLLYGVTDRVGSQLMRLHEARGARSFDIHQHIIIAPSHIINYKRKSHLLIKAYDALSLQQRDNFMKETRRSAKHVPTHTILPSFDFGKIGGTTVYYHNLGGCLRRREVTAVLAARATPAMGLEVGEVGPIETPRHQDTVYLPATTVPPTVVALRPKRAETVARALFSPMGIDLGRHQPMQIIPSMHVKSPEAIITDEGEKPSRAQRAAPAA